MNKYHSIRTQDLVTRCAVAFAVIKKKTNNHSLPCAQRAAKSISALGTIR